MNFTGTKIRWLAVAVFVIASAYVSFNLEGWVEWSVNWGGVMFKVLSGALLGWFISRFVLKLDLSAISVTEDGEPDAYGTILLRALAGLSQAILIGFLALAVATGA